MSFLTGKNQQIQNIPSDIAGLRKNVASWLGGQGLDTALTGMGAGGIAPFMDLFQQQLAPVLAQAKESAGTLTGSSLGNVIGSTAGRSTSEFLLNLLNQRAQRFSSLLSGFGLTGVGAPTMMHQPGFLDYLFQGAQAAAPFLVAGA